MELNSKDLGNLLSLNPIEKAIIKIESIFKEQSVNKITMHRKYLPEIFDADLLEISDSDGLPTLKSDIVSHFWMRGITTKFYGNIIQLIGVGIQVESKNVPIIKDVQEKDLDPRWKNFRDYYMKKLYNAIKNSAFEDWQINESKQYIKKRFHEIYHKQGTLLQKEEEALKFYKKYLKSLPKKKDNFGFYMCLFSTILFFSIAFIMIFILL